MAIEVNGTHTILKYNRSFIHKGYNNVTTYKY